MIFEEFYCKSYFTKTRIIVKRLSDGHTVDDFILDFRASDWDIQAANAKKYFKYSVAFFDSWERGGVKVVLGY